MVHSARSITLLLAWLIAQGLLLKVVGSSVVDPGSIPGVSKLRQKSVIGQEIGNSAIFLFFKNLKF